MAITATQHAAVVPELRHDAADAMNRVPRWRVVSGDPLLPQDAPNTPEEWQREWRVLRERMRQDPDLWMAQRWSVHEWDYEPPLEFVKEFLTLWYQAGAIFRALDQRGREIENQAGFIFRPEAHPEWGRAVRAIDVLVSGERSRRLREQIERPPLAGQHGPRPMVTSEQVDAMERQLVDEERPSGERSIARALGVSRDAVRYARGKDRKRPARG